MHICCMRPHLIGSACGRQARDDPSGVLGRILTASEAAPASSTACTLAQSLPMPVPVRRSGHDFGLGLGGSRAASVDGTLRFGLRKHNSPRVASGLRCLPRSVGQYRLCGQEQGRTCGWGGRQAGSACWVLQNDERRRDLSGMLRVIAAALQQPWLVGLLWAQFVLIRRVCGWQFLEDPQISVACVFVAVKH